MSRRNSWSKIAAVGCLIAAILFVGAALGQTDQQRQADITAKNQQHQQAAVSGPATEKENLTPEEYQNPCGPTEKAYVADLCEQRRMAEAAVRQVDWVKRQFWATVVEIVLLIGVIGVSGWAAWEAGGSAKAAEASVKIASDTANRQLRAYVTLAGVTMEPQPGFKLKIRIHCKNTGQTPAYGLHHVNTVIVGEPADPKNAFAFPAPTKTSSTIDLGAGLPMSFSDDPPALQKETYDAVIAGNIPLYVCGEFRYFDIFKESGRYTRYRMMLSAGSKGFVPCHEGNEST